MLRRRHGAPDLYKLHILLVFIDGVGLGRDEASNPLAARFSGLEALSGGRRWLADVPVIDEPQHVWRPIDTNLDVEGLPQSGTGQASLFTGVNCAKLAGRHYGPYPHSGTRPTIASQNVFRKVQQLFPDEPDPAAFANAYPDRFFTYARKRDWWTVTTRCCLDADVPIRDVGHLQAGTAVSADITGAGWPQANPPISPIDEDVAARRLLDIARAHRFTLFEYYLTDKAGHGRDAERAAGVLASLDRLLGAIYELMDPAGELLLVTSDHGNLEDLSTKSHTRNPVPLAAIGEGAVAFRAVQDLTDVVPAITDALRRS